MGKVSCWWLLSCRKRMTVLKGRLMELRWKGGWWLEVRWYQVHHSAIDQGGQVCNRT